VPAPVVLVHGLATPSARTWTEAGWVELLTDMGKQVVTIDLPGHGVTPPLTDPAGYADLAGWLASQLPGEPVDALGFSLGARTLLGVAAHHPGRIARLVASGVGGQLLTPDPERGRRILDAIEGHPEVDDPNAAYFARLAEHDDVDRGALLDIMRHGAGTLTASDLARISCPVLVVCGDNDDAGPIEPLVEAIPGASGVTLRNTDHFATPKAIGLLDATLDFLV
jgi:pimeloyl-ACP methyl ester carboxylesterase